MPAAGGFDPYPPKAKVNGHADDAARGPDPKPEDYAGVADDVEPDHATDDEAKPNGHARSRFSPCVLYPGDPMPSARELAKQAFTQAGIRTLHRHRSCFYEWTGAHYQPIDSDTISTAAWDFLEQALTKTRGKPRKGEAEGELKAVPFKPNRSRVGDVVAALGAVCNLPGSVEPPTWLTTAEQASKPDAAEMLPVKNGLLHLSSGELYPPTPHFFGLNSTDVAFDPSAPKPDEWLKFLHQLWPDDKASIETLQEWFGLCLGNDTSHHKILMMVGPKRAGKGTIMRTLQGLLGKGSYAAPTLASLGTNFGPAALIGKPLAIIGDARIGSKTDTALIAERLLSISGEDTQTIDRKFMPAWTGRLNTRFFITTNELPNLRDTSGALASRFIVLALTNTFYGREDHGLGNRIDAELSGILNWARDGYVRLQKRGYFIQPTSAQEAVDELDELTSPMRAFVRQRCIVGPGHRVFLGHIFDAWSEWCQANNRKEAGTVQTFGRNIRSVLPGLKTTRPLDDQGERDRAYEGVRLR